MDNAYPAYSTGERIADGIIHLCGVLFALIAGTVMITLAIVWKSGEETAALSVYGAALVLMFTCSAAYHMIPYHDWKGWLRRFDRAAIFMKIAGTYTPFASLKLGGFMGAGLLSGVWIAALAGAGMILATKNRRNSWMILLYLALGWVGIFMVLPLMEAMSATAFILLGIGGLLYSVGVLFHIAETLRYSNAVWHFFVLCAAICHYSAIFIAVFVE